MKVLMSKIICNNKNFDKTIYFIKILISKIICVIKVVTNKII
jgi:hypothetical protein